MSIVEKIVKPTAEILEHIARRIPQALAKGHHRIGQMAHDAADHFEKAERDLASDAEKSLEKGAAHDASSAAAHTAENAAAKDAESAAAKDAEKAAAKDAENVKNAENAGKDAEQGLRPHDPAKDSVPGGERHCETDPVDVATGEMMLPQVDVDLPGALPLVLERVHLSGYRHGGWFGPTWASTLDQRLQLDADGVVFATADGMRLEYPPPRGDAAVLPLKGPRLPLTWSGIPNTPMRVGDPKSGETLVFDDPRPAPGVPGGVVLRLTAIEDRNHRRIDVTWADDDSPALVTHHGGYRIAVDRHPGLRRITGFRLLDAEGPGTEAVLARFGYDEAGDLTEVHGAARTPLRFTYDDRHRVTGWTDRNGTAYGYVYDDAGRVVRTSGPDGFMSATFTYDDTARTTTFTDSLGATATFEHNEAYRLVRHTDPLGNVTVQEWDADGREITAVVDALGRTTSFTRDQAGNLVRVVRPDGGTVHTEYDAFGLPVSVTEPDGVRWANAYDARGNLVAAVDPVGATTTWSYDEHGALTAVTDPLGATTRVETDAAGLPVAVTDPLGHTTVAERDAFGRITAVTDPLGATARYTWSTEGRPLTHTMPDGTEERWEWDGEGNLIAHTDPAGGVTTFEITHFDLTAARTTPDGARLEFGYDTELRLATVTNAQGLTWTYTYDAAGRVTGETDFAGCALTYGHDAAGQLTSRTDALGTTVHYAYDPLGNLTEQRSPEGVTTRAYDATGLLVRAVNADAELVITRDPVGRILSETCNGRTLTSAYDAAGRRTRRTTPGGVVSTWTWDAGDRPRSVTTAGRTLAFTHDAVGRETERALGRDVRLTQRWNPADRLTAQTLTRGPGEVLGERSYRYRADGYLTALDAPAAGARRFTLDPVGRVTAVTGAGWEERYAYDPAGTLAFAATPADPASDGPRDISGGLVRGAGRVRYEHDALGRVVLRQRTRLSRGPDTWRFTWDSEDRLTTVTTPDGQVWRYRHDPLGRRIAKERLAADGHTVREEVLFAWDGPHLAEQTTRVPGRPEELTLTWERDGTRPVTQTERKALAVAPQDAIDERFFAIVTDLVGTPTELVSESGDIAWRRHATLWGIPAGGDGGGAYTPLGFPGQYHDPETRLYYNYFRHYDPATASYLSTDPLGLEAGPDPRGYVPNPLEWLDYLGLLTCAQNARILERNMAREGRPVGAGQAAAHIVPSGGSRRQWAPGARSRALLQRYGIDINDASNGIPLGHPRPHNYTHRGDYLRRVDNHLQRLVVNRTAQGYGRAAIRTALRSELRRIGREVQSELATGTPGAGARWTR